MIDDLFHGFWALGNGLMTHPKTTVCAIVVGMVFLAGLSVYQRPESDTRGVVLSAARAADANLKDAWGRNIEVEVEKGLLVVTTRATSAGRDGQMGTADDIKAKVVRPRWTRRGQLI